MDARKRRILRAVVESYIQSAEPVGSKTLAALHDLGVSPATLRNEMAALEDRGYLEHPHTSAGRVPTPQGYRLYVDELMQAGSLPAPERDVINNLLRRRMAELDSLLEQAGSLMAELTHYVAVTSAVRPPSPGIMKLELFAADPVTLVIVAVLDGGTVKNTLVRLPFQINEDALRTLTSALSGCRDPLSVHEPALRGAAGDGYAYWPFVRDFLRSISEPEYDVRVAGHAQLLSHPEFRDMFRARRTLEYITERSGALMRQTWLDPPGVKITIGPENAAAELADASVVMASYDMGEGLRGILGIVGPTRMDYGGLVSRLHYLASILGKISRDEEDS